MRMSDWSSYECSSDLQGTPVGTATDDGGQYTLVGLETGTTLVFRMVGYKSQEFQYAGQSQLEVMLETDAGNLEEVIVVGFGTQQKSNLTGAVDQISGRQLESRDRKSTRLNSSH